MRNIPILELFGPTIQGEGSVIGEQTMFVRTSGCDYRCDWCDSSFTWDGSARPEGMTPSEIVDALKRKGADRTKHVTLSGGNPLLHASIGHLIDAFEQEGWQTAVETQGTFWQPWVNRIDSVTVSPKPPSSLMTTDFSTLDAFIERTDLDRLSLKVVVFNEEDFEFAQTVHERYPTIPFFLQPGNSEIEERDEATLLPYLIEQYETLVERALASPTMGDVRVLPQLHTFLWGNRQGV